MGVVGPPGMPLLNVPSVIANVIFTGPTWTFSVMRLSSLPGNCAYQRATLSAAIPPFCCRAQPVVEWPLPGPAGGHAGGRYVVARFQTVRVARHSGRRASQTGRHFRA